MRKEDLKKKNILSLIRLTGMDTDLYDEGEKDISNYWSWHVPEFAVDTVASTFDMCDTIWFRLFPCL